MSREKEPIVLDESPRYGVVMPYSSNISPDGDPYLSIYSFEAVRAAYYLYRSGEIDKIVLCGEDTFGKDKPSTTQLMQEMLIAMGLTEKDKRDIAKDIFITPGENLNNTALQLEAIAEAKRNDQLGTKPLTFITWGYHEKRVKNHMKGFGIKGETVTVDSVLERLTAHTGDSLAQMAAPYLPDERKLRFLSFFDRKGRIPMMLTERRGPRVMDRQGDVFINTTARERMAAVVSKQRKAVVSV